jgi:hypothetical protein
MFASIGDADKAVAALHGTPFDTSLLELGNEPSDVAAWPLVALLYVARCQLVRRGARLFPHEGAAELPVCAVCLERMDSSVTGLITTQCTHTFHCSCYGERRFCCDL